MPDQIAPWVPGGYVTLGTDGFGRSDTRPTLRRFFEVDAECIAMASLYALAREGRLHMEFVESHQGPGCGPGEGLSVLGLDGIEVN